MASRATKRIRLKVAGRERASTVSGMLAELEGKSPSRRSKTARSMWTQEFLASGKSGKAG